MGAKTIETAEKYIKKDQQLQKNNDSHQPVSNKSLDEEFKEKDFNSNKAQAEVKK